MQHYLKVGVFDQKKYTETDEDLGGINPFDTSNGIEREFYEQGYIFKDEEAFELYPDKVCYIPELSNTLYTGNDFLSLCGGDKKLARRLFDGVDWQHPEGLLQELDLDEDE